MKVGVSLFGLEVGYSSPSHSAQVFRRAVDMTPPALRSSL